MLSDKCGDGLSAVHAQAVRRYIELLTMEEQKTETKGRGKKGKSVKVDENGFFGNSPR